ncbi:MAG: DUF3800 domain-containing protein, partial [Planctomycetota bacterium]|nr:DUF3800 domain-containing protein [Planctomycetota bacterium]MDI6788263.1 DUF3800 domain-containing protein [Planctomycetota bacterium]
MNKDKTLYVFIDEGGNLDFSPSGTKYFVLSSISWERPFDIYVDLTNLKYDLLEQASDVEIEYFHASEDKQHVRDMVFDVIKKYLSRIRIDSVVVEKRKTMPSMQKEERFYPYMIRCLLKYVMGGYDLSTVNKVIVFTDAIPIYKKKHVIEGAIKTILKPLLVPDGKVYKILHHSSKSNFNLQVADY